MHPTGEATTQRGAVRGNTTTDKDMFLTAFGQTWTVKIDQLIFVPSSQYPFAAYHHTNTQITELNTPLALDHGSQKKGKSGQTSKPTATQQIHQKQTGQQQKDNVGARAPRPRSAKRKGNELANGATQIKQ